MPVPIDGKHFTKNAPENRYGKNTCSVGNNDCRYPTTMAANIRKIMVFNLKQTRTFNAECMRTYYHYRHKQPRNKGFNTAACIASVEEKNKSQTTGINSVLLNKI